LLKIPGHDRIAEVFLKLFLPELVQAVPLLEDHDSETACQRMPPPERSLPEQIRWHAVIPVTNQLRRHLSTVFRDQILQQRECGNFVAAGNAFETCGREAEPPIGLVVQET
jgi:hypothetical protein